MREITTWVLIIAAYPFIAAWLVGLRRGYQINELEEQLVLLREKVKQLSPAPPETPAPRPADMAVSTMPKDDVEQVPPAVLPDSAHAQVQGVDGTSASASVDDAQTIHRSPQAKRGTPRRGRSRGSPIQHEAITPPLDPDASTKAVSPPPRWLVAVKTWLMTGNLVAKLGLVILFIGIAFLLKYVAATITIPIELRLAALVLADMGLLGWGWRLRSKRREIGLPVQGTAIAILMLVIFSAFQRYALIPAEFAFALLVSLTVFTSSWPFCRRHRSSRHSALPAASPARCCCRPDRETISPSSLTTRCSTSASLRWRSSVRGISSICWALFSRSVSLGRGAGCSTPRTITRRRRHF